MPRARPRESLQLGRFDPVLGMPNSLAIALTRSLAAMVSPLGRGREGLLGAFPQVRRKMNSTAQTFRFNVWARAERHP